MSLAVLAILAVLAACAQGSALRGPQAFPFAVAPLGLRTQRGVSDIDGHIVGGDAAEPKQFPHQASMQIVMPGFLSWDADPQHICGGSLIAEGWVLTAAHCVYGVPKTAKRVEVALGINNLYEEGSGVQRFRVAKMIPHEQYDPVKNHGVGPFDIALLKLDRAADLNEFVKLAVLPTKGALPTGDATLSGWGSTSQDGMHPIYPEELRTAVFPIVDFKTCSMYIGNVSPKADNPLVDTNLCVGPLDRTGLSSCSGDSGGPLIQMDGDNAVVIGVVSWGLADCASYPYPSVFTRTSAYIDWIDAQIAKQ